MTGDLNVNPEVLALAAEAGQYSWKSGPDILAQEQADRLAAKNSEIETLRSQGQAVLAALEAIGESIDGGFTTTHIIALLEELGQRRADHTQLYNWLNAHTKVDLETQSPILAAINLLETSRLMVHHLTPAVTHIVQSAMDALRSAGVDVEGLSK